MIDGLKPYADYKGSSVPWMERVPSHWRVVRNGSLFSPRNQTGFAQLPVLEVSLKTGVRVRDLENSARKQVMSDFGKYKRAAQGDLAYNMMRMWQGAIGVVPVDGLVSPAYVVARPFVDVVSPYYAYLFRTADYMHEVDAFSRGIVKDRNRLYWDQFKQMPSLAPPPEEQAAIVRFLDHASGRIERAIRAKKKLIALLNEQKQALIHRAVTRGLDPTVPLKPSGIPWLGDIPDHWEIIPLKYLCRRIQNGSTPTTEEGRYYEDGTVPWFGPSSIGIISQLGAPVRHLSPSAFADGKARLIHGPAILIIVIGATAGKMGLLTSDGATNQQITAFELKGESLIPEFGIEQLRCSETWLKSTASTATIPILDSGIVSRLPLGIPSSEEQTLILDFISVQTQPVQTAVARTEREIALLREYRTRLASDVVTGQLDVREAARQLPDPSEEPAPLDDPEATLDDDELDPAE